MAPRYDDLPRPAPETGNNSGLPLSWGTWGEDDQIGTFNRLTPETVAAAAAKIGVLVRGTENRQDYSGISGAEDMRRFLWDSGVVATCADNPTVEVWPYSPFKPTLHWAIARLGLVIGEFFDFESLAADSAASGRYTAFFTAAPPHLRGGIGSPGNALAIKSPAAPSPGQPRPGPPDRRGGGSAAGSGGESPPAPSDHGG